MAGHSAGGSRDSRGRADGADTGSSETGLWEMARENEEQLGSQDLAEYPVEAGAPEKEKDAGLVAEAEAIAAGWMLDFLCLSLCRAFRDGRSEDFHRTRDSAEGECRARRAAAAGGGRGLVCGAVPGHPGGWAGEGGGAEGPRLRTVGGHLASAYYQPPQFSSDSEIFLTKLGRGSL